MKYLFTLSIVHFQKIAKINSNFNENEIEDFLTEIDEQFIDLPFMVNCGNTVDIFDFIEEMVFNNSKSLEIKKTIIECGKGNEELFLKIVDVIIHKNYIELYFEI